MFAYVPFAGLRVYRRLSVQTVDMVIFRENTEDIYAGIEWEAGSDVMKKVLGFLKENFPKDYAKVRFPESSGVGIKAVSREGTERLVRSAIEFALSEKRKDRPSRSCTRATS